MADGLLIKQEKYLEAGIHIGTKLRVIDMTRFIYRTRNDGLFVLDLRKIDERIRLAGKLLAKYEPKDIVVVASRAYSSMAAQKFASVTGCNVVAGRFVPGAFTNVQRDDFVEPKLVIICDPKGERQAVLECGKMGVPTIGLCDTDNYTMFIDWVIPCNNKGRRSLALIFWLLAREMAMGAGKIASYDDYKLTLEEFETMAPPAEAPAAEGAAPIDAGVAPAPAPGSTDEKAAGIAEEAKKAEIEKPRAKRAKEEDSPEMAESKRKARKAVEDDDKAGKAAAHAKKSEDDEKAAKAHKKAEPEEKKAEHKHEEKKEHEHKEKKE